VNWLFWLQAPHIWAAASAILRLRATSRNRDQPVYRDKRQLAVARPPSGGPRYQRALTIADMATWPWYDRTDAGESYDGRIPERA
jgi:hypothetical protein